MGLLNSRAKGQKLVIPVKGNAYGHGMVEISKMLVEEGIEWLAVTNMNEARELREEGIQVAIMLLSSPLQAEYELVVAYDITMIAHDLDVARGVSETAIQMNRSVNVHVEIDTGMSRQGQSTDSIDSFVDELALLPGIEVTGLMTHFATSDELDESGRSYFKSQLQSFREISSQLQSRHPSIVELHCGNSGAILIESLADMTMVRPGIATYGLWPSSDVQNASDVELEPVLSWKTRVMQIKELDDGAFISYGCTYRTNKKTRVAILPVGYYDGLFRSLSNSGHVLINGKRAQILGRVCMNHTVVDVSEIDASIGDDVVLIGKQGSEVIYADDHAQWGKTINYECVTRLARHVKRTVINS
ncbi:alanine racemase [Candidatus Uhrbacteria bacterium]|nr:alanine racemase [Candidatus Uhrbacteria bacterium]